MNAARIWAPRAVAVVAFITYALAAPPGWYWLDAGELSAASIGLGSPHPTGFPLYIVLAKAATLLVPVGELGFRLNLLSAAAGALAVLWTARLVCEVCRDDAAAVAGSVAAGSSLTWCLVFFRHASTAEVYVPTAALIALSLLLLARVARGADARVGLGLSLLAGLGLGAHGSYRLLLGVPIAALLLVRLRRGARWPLLAPLVALGVAAALHAMLPVRSDTGRTAAVDWGHPRTAHALYAHAVTAERIQRAFGRHMMLTEPLVVRARVATTSGQVTDHHGLLGLLAAAGGLAWLFASRRSRWLASALTVVLAGDLAYAVFLNPMGNGDMQNGVPFAVAAAIATGAGVAWLARRTGVAAPFAGGALAVIVSLPAAVFAWDARWAAAAGDAPRRWAEAAFDSVAPRGVALVETDDLAAGMLMMSVTEGARPDVAVLVKQHLRDRERTGVMLARADAPAVAEIARLPELGRALWWEPGRIPPPRGLSASPGLPLGPAGPAAPDRDLRAALHGASRVFDAPDAEDPRARDVFARALGTLGRLEVQAKRFDAARALFEAALAAQPRHAASLVNLGVIAARQGRHAAALALSARAIAIAPLHGGAHINHAYYRFKTGDLDGAARFVDRGLLLSPANADGWALAGILDANAGRIERARARLAWALVLDPRQRDARAALAKLRH